MSSFKVGGRGGGHIKVDKRRKKGKCDGTKTEEREEEERTRKSKTDMAIGTTSLTNGSLMRFILKEST